MGREATITPEQVHAIADAIKKAQQGIEGLIPGDDLSAHFLGDGFVPPLEEKPLRKK